MNTFPSNALLSFSILPDKGDTCSVGGGDDADSDADSDGVAEVDPTLAVSRLFLG